MWSHYKNREYINKNKISKKFEEKFKEIMDSELSNENLNIFIASYILATQNTTDLEGFKSVIQSGKLSLTKFVCTKAFEEVNQEYPLENYKANPANNYFKIKKGFWTDKLIISNGN